MAYRGFLLNGVALVGLVASGGALAQDADYSWTGARVGGSVGIGMGATLFNDPIVEVGTLGSVGLNGGLFGGYDFEVAPGLVFGVEAGVEFYNDEASTTQLTVLDQYQFRSLGAAYAGIRAGAEIAPRTLAYAGISYASIHAETSADTFDPQQTFLDGYRAAVGMETEVTDNLTVRLEGSYTKAVESLVVNGGSFDYRPAHFGANLGVTYRFGTESDAPRIDVEPIRSWTGGYVGVLAGGLGTSTANGFRELLAPPADGPVSTVVGEYGAYMGVNLQIGDNFVIGVEGDISKYDAKYDFVGDDFQDFASSDIKAQASARFGYLVNPETLIYARAGWGLMHINPDPTFAAAGTESAYLQSASAGLGIEAMVNEHALLRVEGLYNTALEEYRFQDPSTAVYSAKPTSVEARVGAAFMF